MAGEAGGEGGGQEGTAMVVWLDKAISLVALAVQSARVLEDDERDALRRQVPRVRCWFRLEVAVCGLRFAVGGLGFGVG